MTLAVRRSWGREQYEALALAAEQYDHWRRHGLSHHDIYTELALHVVHLPLNLEPSALTRAQIISLIASCWRRILVTHRENLVRFAR